jgi:hypothetical protein
VPPVATPTDERTFIEPCAPSNPEVASARRKIEALDRRIDSLAADADPAELGGEIRALFGMRCFELARADVGHSFEWDSALSLRSWWRDGGRDWLRGSLFVEAAPGRPIVGTPPDVRFALTSESATTPIAPLLCPARAVDNRSCGAETGGYRLRADEAPQNRRDAIDPSTYCADVARKNASASRYAAFRACLEESGRIDALPLGVFQAPKDGWFVVSHSVFIAQAGCRENVTAYDLATGATYAVGCRPAPPLRVAVGRVPLGALREAAWMSMLQHTATIGVRTSVRWFDVPADIPVRRLVDEMVTSPRLVIEWSDAPVVDWAWIRKGKGAVSGRFETPTSSLSAHAASLLRIMDEGFQEGCAPSAPPIIPWTALGPNVAPSERTDVGELFAFVDRAKTLLPAARAGTAPCPVVP